MLISETVRATSAAEAHYRVRAPNALPRAVMVVALDAQTAELAEELAARPWRGTSFFTAVAGSMPGAPKPFARWLRDITGEAADLVAEVSAVDVVQLLATAGQDTPYASLIGEACALRGVKTSGLVIDNGESDPAALSHSLKTLRPWVVTLSVIGSASYVDEILHALGG